MTNVLKALYDHFHPQPADDNLHLSTPETRAEASSALSKANTDLNDVIRREPTVTALAGKLRIQMERNHFAELITASMRKA